MENFPNDTLVISVKEFFHQPALWEDRAGMVIGIRGYVQFLIKETVPLSMVSVLGYPACTTDSELPAAELESQVTYFVHQLHSSATLTDQKKVLTFRWGVKLEDGEPVVVPHHV